MSHKIKHDLAKCLFGLMCAQTRDWKLIKEEWINIFIENMSVLQEADMQWIWSSYIGYLWANGTFTASRQIHS